MKTYRFWIAAFLSVSLHAVALGLSLSWGVATTRAELLEPYGDSDVEGFNVGAIALDPGTWRQGDQHTPGGDDAPEKQEKSFLDEEPLKVEVKPVLPAPSPLPAVLPDPGPPEPPARVAEKSGDSTSDPKSQPSSTKVGLAGASGGSDMPLGTPSRGGIVGKPTGVELLRAGRKTYPAEAARLEQEGVPQVWVRVSEEGDVVEVKLHQSCGYPLLDEAALRYALTMKFRPARRGDRPVESTAVQPVRYRLP